MSRQRGQASLELLAGTPAPLVVDLANKGENFYTRFAPDKKRAAA